MHSMSSTKRPRGDPVIGLDVSGTVYYCRTSTVAQQLSSSSSSYFVARFGPDRMLDPEVDRIDDMGREIFFIDRDPDIFKYVLAYLRTNKLPATLGSFEQNPNLWRALRDEADFFSLDGLTSLLKATITHSRGKSSMSLDGSMILQHTKRSPVRFGDQLIPEKHLYSTEQSLKKIWAK